MLITKRQLRIIIKEALNEKYGKDYLSKTHPDGKGEERDPKLDFAEGEDDEKEMSDPSGLGFELATEEEEVLEELIEIHRKEDHFWGR